MNPLRRATVADVARIRERHPTWGCVRIERALEAKGLRVDWTHPGAWVQGLSDRRLIAPRLVLADKIADLHKKRPRWSCARITAQLRADGHGKDHPNLGSYVRMVFQRRGWNNPGTRTRRAPGPTLVHDVRAAA